MSRYSDIAGGVAEKLAGTDAFETLVVSPISSGGQIFDVLDAMTKVPGAVIAFSGADFDEEGLEKKLRLLVIVVDRFRRGSAAKAAGAWHLVEAVETLCANGLTSCGIPFTPVSWEPVDSGKETITAFAITLEGSEA